MAKFHISPKSGEPRPCSAVTCPFGDNAPHYGTKEEAYKALENENIMRTFTAMSRKDPNLSENLRNNTSNREVVNYNKQLFATLKASRARYEAQLKSPSAQRGRSEGKKTLGALGAVFTRPSDAFTLTAGTPLLMSRRSPQNQQAHNLRMAAARIAMGL